MTIKYTKVSIFDSPAGSIVNPVNTMGIMGAGVALQVKNRFPEIYYDYKEACDRGEVKIGKLHYKKASNGQWIIHFPTKIHWNNASTIEFIEAGLISFADLPDHLLHDGVSFPKLGCGHGKLDFESQVKPLMLGYLQNMSGTFYIHI